MDWLFNSGKTAKKMKAWRFVYPLATGMCFMLVARAIALLQEGIYAMPYAPPPAVGSMTVYDWTSLAIIALGVLTLLFAFYQAYQDHTHGKWQEVAWRYKNRYHH
ncbi:hypothetical protein [Comamonas sp.]|uniref:hypothetical protein n=1 Tax=Comamonas sp. TaxID=34028 RepID=UPI003D0E6F35